MGVIRIRLMSDLCSGNGESVGYGIDSDICTDNYGFPYIPGKRILGCLRDSAIHLGEFGLQEANEENIDEIFGNENGKCGKLTIGNAVIPGIESLHSYIQSLKDQKDRDYLIRQCTEEKIIRLYSSIRGQTRIGDDGKAEGGSLRFIRVLNQYNPFNEKEMEFVCKTDTTGLNEDQIQLLEKTCKTLRHIGLNRTRGLGNILVVPELQDSDIEDNIEENDISNENSDQVQIYYQVEFASPITVQEYLEETGQINARTMIGFFSGIYLRENKEADQIFNDLFLNGTVKWSGLTPIINELHSDPVPAMIMKLKNDGGKLVNTLAPRDGAWKKKKPKSLDGYFAAFDKGNGKLYISQPETETAYHNRMNESDNEDRARKGLYVQEALREGMKYGGYVILPKDKVEDVKKILSVGRIRLGRSKKAQYGSATVKKIMIKDFCPAEIDVEEEETVVAILRSDLAIQDKAVFRTDTAYIREKIAGETGLINEIPDKLNDVCRYRVITGYHNMWEMQKPKIQVVMGGSVYCFKGKKGKYPSHIIIGEYQQEGMGHIELVPMSVLKEMKDISYKKISGRDITLENDHVNGFEQKLLYEAAMAEIQAYAFKFKKDDDTTEYKNQILKEIPSGRIRQMLSEATNIAELWTMIESMKTSDVSSESKGKKAASKKLLEKLYGNDKNNVDFKRMIEDKALWSEVQKSQNVLNMLNRNWEEPMFTLLHVIHYQKGRR